MVPWDAVGAVAEFAGAIAVVASLIYLGRQFRHSSTYALESIYYQAIASFTASPENSSVVIRGCLDFDSLTAEEQFHFYSLFHQLFSAIEQIHEQSNRRLANPSSHERAMKVARRYLSTPGFLEIWRHGTSQGGVPLRGMFSDRFAAEVERTAEQSVV